MAAIVDCDDAAGGPVERAHPMGVAPIGRNIGGEAVDEQDRLSPALVDIGDLTPSESKLCILDLPLWLRGSLCSLALPQARLQNDGSWRPNARASFRERPRRRPDQDRRQGVPMHGGDAALTIIPTSISIWGTRRRSSALIARPCSCTTTRSRRRRATRLLHLRRDRPARRAGGLRPPHGQAGRSGAHRRRRHRRTCLGHCARLGEELRASSGAVPIRRRERRRHSARSQRHAGPAHAWRPRCYRATQLRPEAIVIYDGVAGRRLASMPLGKDAETRYGAPYLTLHRADLHAGASCRGRRPRPRRADGRTSR